MNSIHIPVLLNEVIEQLDPQPSDRFLDGTLGFGGHASHILPFLTEGTYTGIDQDPVARQHTAERFKSNTNVRILEGNFSEAFDLLNKHSIAYPTKILLDLGYSSFQLDQSQRGFSFLSDELLDMRMNPTAKLTAFEILQRYDHKKLSDVFFNYGELRHNKKLVENIIHTRKIKPIKTTTDLVELIKKSYFFNQKRSLFMKTCSQVFQALRIEVNKELDHLNTFLTQLELAPPNVRVAIISFHSIEDRVIKHTVKEKTYLRPVLKKPLQATQQEISENSRSKSAKLRVFETV